MPATADDDRPVSFEFATAARLLFGEGRAAEVPAEVATLGLGRVLLVTGRPRPAAEALAAGLLARGVAVEPFRVSGEPTVEVAREGVARAREAGCQGVVALGGGSAIDAGKAVAALAPNGGDVLDFLEVIGRGQPLLAAPLPCVAVPTTAGTGSEVTRNAVLGSAAGGVKASLRSPLMLPRLAVVDPDLLAGAPPALLASSGLDALTQLIEPFLSARATPLTDALAAEGIRRSVRSLRAACAGPPEAGHRRDLALASLLGGLCLANAGLGAVHGFAAPAGGALGAPHGALCAALLAATLEVNLRALRQRAPHHPSLAKFHDLAAWLTGRPGAAPEEAVSAVASLVGALGVRGLAHHGLDAAGVPGLVERARRASSMKGNPVVLTDAELTEIVERSMPDAAA